MCAAGAAGVAAGPGLPLSAAGKGEEESERIGGRGQGWAGSGGSKGKDGLDFSMCV